MNLFADIRNHVVAAVESLALGDALPLDAITVEPPKDASHGDASTNAAMVLAKAAGQNPRVLAEKIRDALLTSPIGLEARKFDPGGSNFLVQGQNGETILGEGNNASLGSPHPNPLPEGEGMLESIDIAGAGFINFRFRPAFWQAVIPAIHEEGLAYGDSTIGKGVRVNVEYVSANPTGPMHVGHARGAVVGDALARLLIKAGYDVTKEYYINDAGAQVGVLAQSAFLRYREACGESITIPDGLYPGDYLIPVGQALKEKYGGSLNAEDVRIKPFVIEAMMNLIRADLNDLGIKHDVFTSEAALDAQGGVGKAIDWLEAKGLVYRGMLEPPKGKKTDDWEEREQLLFKSSQFGDDSDRTLQKADGSYTYFAGDLPYLQDKIGRGFTRLIYMLGADHGGYVKRLAAAGKAFSEGKVEVDVKLCQLVNLYKDGQPFKMSKRAGTFITVRDLIDEVGRDIIRFIMLIRKNDQAFDFDFEKVKEQSKDNPVFYVQYAHARAKSLWRLAASEMPDALAIASPNYALLTHEAELRVMKEAAQFPRIVEAAARSAEPHRIAYYLHELAAAFHGLWHVGSKDADLRILVPNDAQLTASRLGLAKAVAVVIACGLSLLGVEPKEEL